MLRSRTRDAVLAEAGPISRFIADPGGGFYYSDLLRRLWREPGPLVIVEQDVVPPPGALAALLACPEEWCGHLLPAQDHLISRSLGLAKFSRSLLERLPDIADQALARPPYLRSGRCRKWDEPDLFPEGRRREWPSTVAWPSCDIYLQNELGASGVDWHQHDPPVEHLHWEAPENPLGWPPAPIHG
jgi:hypothetical protein